MTDLLKDARELTGSVRRSRPGAYALARVVSLAARIEPALIRRARIELLPRLDAGDEADLWFSPLVQARSPLAIVFSPEVAEVLRGELARDGDGAQPLGDELAREATMLGRAWQLVRRVHAKAAPVILLEEEVTYLALSDEPDASEKIRALLLSAALTMSEGDGRELAQWALRALPRLPEEVRDSEAAWTLAVGAGARLGGRRILAGELPDTISQNRLRWVLPRDHKQTPVGVRLVEAGIEISEPPAEGAHAIQLPKTDPLFLEVSWGEGAEANVKPVTLRPGQTQTIEAGALAEVSISTPTGETFNIRREYEFDVFIDPVSAASLSLEDQIVSRLQGEEWEGRPLKVTKLQVIGMHPDMAYMSEEVLQGFGQAFEANRQEAARSRRASRKVIKEINEEELKRLSARAHSSPGDEANDPRLIRIYTGALELPPELEEHVDVDFRDESRFEYNFRKLLARIKDEPFSEPSDAPERSKPVKLYYAYSHEDERLRSQLEQHLAPLRREGIIEEWHDRMISGGSVWETEIKEQLDSADLILLLVSTDFLNSDFAHNVEMKRALERQEAAETRIVPVILRPCEWMNTPLGRFQALPPEGRPVTSWSNPEEAFQLVAEGIRHVALEIAREKEATKAPDAGREPSYEERLEQLVAERLTKVPDIAALTRMEESEVPEMISRGVSPQKELARRIVRGGLFELEERLRPLVSYLSDGDARQIIDMVATLSVNQGAAETIRRAVVERVESASVLFLNNIERLIGQLHIWRACGEWPPWTVIIMKAVNEDEEDYDSGDQLIFRVESAIKERFGLGPDMDGRALEDWLRRRKEPIIILFDMLAASNRALYQLRMAHPTLTLFMLTTKVPPREEIPDYAELVYTNLSPDEDYRIQQTYESLQSLLRGGRLA